MHETYFGVRLLFVVLIILVNGFFAAAEVSLLSTRESRLRQLAAEGKAGAQSALNLLANPERLLSVTQVGVTLASLGLGWAGEDTLYALFLKLFGPVIPAVTAGVVRAAAFVLSFAVISFCHVVIGEVVPKNIAIDKADRLAVTVAPALQLFYRISAPFAIVVERASSGISRWLKLHGGHRGGGHSAEELKLIVTSSRGLGYLPERQEDMIHRVLDLENIYVREIMVPRNGIVAVSVDATLDEVLRTMIQHGHSRLPVWETNAEQVAGMLHYKDLLPLWQERRAAIRSGRPARPFRVRPLLRRHLVVPETKPLSQMLEEFRQGHSHMALVVDEFGTITGLVTVEDVLEEIVGAIEDEHDDKAHRPRAEATLVEVDGAMRIRDLEALYGIELPSDAGFETLAGFLLFRLGAIPQVGQTVEHEGRCFTVLEMDRHRIAKVKIEKMEAEGSKQAAESKEMMS